MRIDTRTAANVGLLVALSIILTRFFGVMVPLAGVLALRVSFGEIPLILAGLLFGPVAGGVAGIASDLIGFMINSHGGPFFPGFTLTAALTGMIPGLLLYKRQEQNNLSYLAVAIGITQVAGSLLNTLWLTIIMEKGFFVLLPPRLLSLILIIPIYTAAVYTIRRAYYAAIPGLSHM